MPSAPRELNDGAVQDADLSLPHRYESELRRFLVGQLGQEFEEIDRDTPLLETGILDSILIQSLLAFIEDEYQILLPAEEVRPERFGTIGGMAEVILRCRGEVLSAEATDALEVLNRIMESYGLEREWIELPTGRRHILRSRGRSPTLVLLSGLGSPASSWGMLLRALNDQREAIALDLAGFGVSESNRDGDFSFESHVRDTMAVIDHVTTEPCVLVGNSAGAMIAAEVARIRPDRCRALIVISFGRVRDGRMWWRTLEQLSDDVDAFWTHAFYDPPPLTNRLKAQLESTLASRAYRDFLDKETVAGLDQVFGGIKAPTMFIGGMEDGIISREIVEAGAAQVQGARLEWLPRCGHYAQSERSQEVLVYLESFLSQTLGG